MVPPPNNENFAQSVDRWSQDYFNNNSILIDQVETFSEIAISSFYPRNNFKTNYIKTDTVRYVIPFKSSFTTSDVATFAKDMEVKSKQYLTEQFDGMDVSFWKGIDVYLVQLLVFTKENAPIDIRSYCDYEETESWHWDSGTWNWDCDNPGAIDQLQVKFTNNCYFTQEPLWCETSSDGDPSQLPKIALTYKLTPAGVNSTPSMPCDSWSSCDDIWFPFNPAKCEDGSEPGYCDYLSNTSSSQYPYKLFFKYDVNFDYCLTGGEMNYYQESIADFAFSILDDGLYGLNDQYWNVYKVYIEYDFLIGGSTYLHTAHIIYSSCSPTFN